MYIRQKLVQLESCSVDYIQRSLCHHGDHVAWRNQCNRNRSPKHLVIQTPFDIDNVFVSVMSNWLQLYGNLQRNLATSYTGSQQSVRIPNTVIFHRRKPILWFQTPAKGHGVLERKSNSGGIEVAQVFRTFIDNASCPIVATMIWYCEKAAMPSTFGDLKLKHLDEQQLRSLLLHTVKGLILPAYWILQGFIGPGNDGHVSTIVSESLGSSKKYSAIISKNRHAFGSFSKIHEACLTVESADTKHSRLEKINDKFLNEAVIDVSDIACRCCASVDQSIGVTFFFRVDKSNLLWLLWCSIPQQQIQKKVIPRAINSHDNHTVINDRSRTFLLHSNCCEILEAAFSAENGIIQVTICDDEKRQQEESFFLMIKYDEEVVTYEKLIDVFWSTITSTEDSGSEYETSVIYYSTAQQQLIAESSAWRNAQSRISLGLAVLQHQVTIQPISADLRLIPCSIPVDKPESESEHVHDNNKIPFQSSSSTRKSDTNGREESQDDERAQYRQATINADKKMALRHSTAPPRRKNSILPVKRKGRRGGRGGSGTQRESRSGDGHRKPRKVSIKEIADVMKTVDDEIRFEDDRDVTAKLTASKNLTVGDVAVRPKSLSFNNTRLALLCNPKGDYIKPLPSVTSTKTGTEKRLLYDNNGPEILEGSALEATEHALMRLRLEIKDLQLDIVKSHRASESVPFKAKPPVGRASSFPTTRSRSSQLSKNRYAKDVELSEAVPTIVDPVIIIRPPKPIPIEIPIQVIGSMPLEFSKKFGDFGRRTKAVADGQLKIKGPAPPGQAEDLMDITSEIVRKVCGNLIKLLSGSCEAARKHRDLLIHEQLTKNTKIQSNKLFPFENDVVDEGFTRDKIVSDTVCKVEESLRNRIGENDAIDGPQKYGNDINIEFVYKKKTPVPENDNTNLDTNKIQKIQENNDAEGVPEDGGSNDKKKENFSEKSFLGLIKQMSCVPNHRPVEELCTVLLWLLASGSDGSSSSSGSKSDREDDMTDANGTIKSVSAFDSNQTSIILEAFSQYAKHAKACLTEVTHIQVSSTLRYFILF